MDDTRMVVTTQRVRPDKLEQMAGEMRRAGEALAVHGLRPRAYSDLIFDASRLDLSERDLRGLVGRFNFAHSRLSGSNLMRCTFAAGTDFSHALLNRTSFYYSTFGEGTKFAGWLHPSVGFGEGIERADLTWVDFSGVMNAWEVPVVLRAHLCHMIERTEGLETDMIRGLGSPLQTLASDSEIAEWIMGQLMDLGAPNSLLAQINPELHERVEQSRERPF